jgi:4-hydroxy-tetrahydrodipicolinate synthase
MLSQAIGAGAHGGVTGGANLQPELYVDLYRAAKSANRAEVRRLQQRVLDLSDAVYHVGEPSTSYIRGLKCALGLAGVCSDLPAAPLSRFEPEERRTIEENLRALTSMMVDA